ncbi:hypothetical protein [Erythrobacter sp. WG]|uniref:hypothetical protein n=1 Tax=Erythrobacter sp. WG TaxID=2985510 RepID=UPI00226FCCFA|nr:hypothetical protein [Erythrobacter sp. WG]MCX9147239.1 YbjP/YqhG family protein [Erythrobacter sp. WG]
MIKTRWATLGAAGALAMALGGCGGAAPGDTAEAVAAETPPAATSPATGDEAAARAFVDTLFAAYANDGEPNLFLAPNESFEPELAAAITALNERTEKTGMIEASQDADPICACQDYGEVSHAIDSITFDGNRAKAVVTFTNFGTSQKRTLDLIAVPGGWRIFDIDGSYRKAVFDDVKQP